MVRQHYGKGLIRLRHMTFSHDERMMKPLTRDAHHNHASEMSTFIDQCLGLSINLTFSLASITIASASKDFGMQT